MGQYLSCMLYARMIMFNTEIKRIASALLSRSKTYRNYTSRVFNYELNLNALVFINLL